MLPNSGLLELVELIADEYDLSPLAVELELSVDASNQQEAILNQ